MLIWDTDSECRPVILWQIRETRQMIPGMGCRWKMALLQTGYWFRGQGREYFF
jgi:hypothetical protein